MKFILILMFISSWAIVGTTIDQSLENEKVSCQENEMETGEIDESLNDLDQEDPVLIEAVKKLLIKPPSEDVPYNLSHANDADIAMGGQFQQVIHLFKLFGRKKNGFFIEAGAYDGEEYSNTLYFEKKLGWKGILVEPNPDALRELKFKKRRGHIFGHCLSTKKTPETVLFDASGLIGGIINGEKKPTTGDEFKSFLQFKDLRIHQRTIKIQCFPLYSILMALGNPTVDLFSLDVEGSEFKILQTIPWNKVDIKVLLIETDHLGKIFDGSLKELEDLLKTNGYKFYQSIEIDHVYTKHDFPLPGNK